VIFSPEKSALAWADGATSASVHTTANNTQNHLLIGKPPSIVFVDL